MERRKFLEMLIVGSLAEYIGGCASAPVPASEIVDAPTMRNTLPQGFQQADHLFINTNPSAHYYVDGLSKRKGLYQLRDLAKTSDVEEGFVHVQAGTRSLWFEIGEQEEIMMGYGDQKGIRRRQVNTGRVINNSLLPALQKMCLGDLEITTSHLHLQRNNSGSEYAFHNFRRDGKIIVVNYSPEILFLPSPNDVLVNVLTREFLTLYPLKHPLKGKIKLDDIVVTPAGYFTLQVQENFYKEVIDACKEESFDKTKERLDQLENNLFSSKIRTLTDASYTLAMTGETDTVTLDLEAALQALREDNLWKDIPIHYHPF